jgi:hypothetical protein
LPADKPETGTFGCETTPRNFVLSFTMTGHSNGGSVETHGWTRARPSRAADGPPGLAALLDAERSALREYQLRLRDAEDARLVLRRGQGAVASAARARLDSGRGGTGMRGRFRARPEDSARDLDQTRQQRTELFNLLEMATTRLGVAQQRLANVRGLVDSIAGLETDTIRLIEPLRRTATLPPRAIHYPSLAAYVDADPRRAVADFHARSGSGERIGELWSLEETDRPWITTHWRVHWRAPSDPCAGEVYAEQQGAGSRRQSPVWLLGTVPHEPKAAAALAEATQRIDERNSLALLAFTVSTVLNG